MRDIIKLFTDRDSRDELGLGQVRDAISDGLFPGTSVLLTRARYLLFVPWCFQLAEGRPDAAGLAERHERLLICTLRKSGNDDLSGLLGARVGQALQTLPSTIYWGTLRRYGIVREEYAWKTDVFRPLTRSVDGDDEGARKTASAWSHTIPPMPPEFPHRLDDGFRLLREEAGWLRDRIFDRAPGTVIAHLMDHVPLKESRSPWSDPGVRSVEGAAAELLRNAEAFSTAMHGARCSTTCCLPKSTSVISRRSGESILRLLISTGTSLPFGRRGPTRLESLTGKLEVCGAGSLAPRRRRLRPARNASSPTGLLTSRATTPTRSPTTVARKVVRDRERRQKGALARLGNPKRLSAWSGAAGAGALTFRWTTVRDIVLDIHAGLGRDA